MGPQVSGFPGSWVCFWFPWVAQVEKPLETKNARLLNNTDALDRLYQDINGYWEIYCTIAVSASWDHQKVSER